MCFAIADEACGPLKVLEQGDPKLDDPSLDYIKGEQDRQDVVVKERDERAEAEASAHDGNPAYFQYSLVGRGSLPLQLLQSDRARLRHRHGCVWRVGER
jgi:hypothetical protein